ncbi:MAG: sulfite exporter TauE/SafE family protein [Brooklawnia sp.]|uniref:sulfite exporter TauE/SafE family protein n=1 Tax=Brooklawnia sp. TaxID=2699740 RepID=UPI003C77871F
MDWTWLPMVTAALIIGIAKTSFGGLGSVAVALLAFVLPTKESTAAALLLLIVGDIVGVLRYRSNADWGLLRGLLPSVVPGLLLGAVFIWAVDDLTLRRSIGALLLISVLVQLASKLRDRGAQPVEDASHRPPRALTIGAGVAAGFTTMAANAAGPVTAVYLQLSRVNKLRFLGTSAWFYFIVNLSKTPLSAALGLFTRQVMTTVAVLIPVVLVGTLIGMGVIGRVKQRTFDVLTLLTSVVAAGALIVL